MIYWRVVLTGIVLFIFCLAITHVLGEIIDRVTIWKVNRWKKRN